MLSLCDDPEQVQDVVAECARRCGEAEEALRTRSRLTDPWGDQLGLLRPCFARTEPWLQAGSVFGVGQRAAEGERVEYRPTWPGPDAGTDAAAVEPRERGVGGG